MTLPSQSALGFVLKNYADVIEGGNAYRGSGTAHPGVPGVLSVHENNATSVFADAGSTTTALIAAGMTDAIEAVIAPVWNREGMAPWFALGSDGANEGVARKVASYTTGTNTLNVAAFPYATEGLTFTVVEGFRRMPDNIETLGEPDGRGAAFDRGFRLSMEPGEELEICGSGTKRYQAELVVELRLRKLGKDSWTKESALENAQRIRAALVDGARRDGTYTQWVSAFGTKPDITDKGDHVEVIDRLHIVYRIHGKLS